MLDSEVIKAVEILSSGGVILYPTDTIWGLGCDPTNAEAVQRIYGIKQRSDSKNMLVLVSGWEMLSHYIESVPEKAFEIIDSATKPTTIIYPGARNLAPNLIAEDGSLGIRITTDPFCMKLLERFGRPIVSTSANISGAASPGVFKEISPSLIEQVDHVVQKRQNESKTGVSSRIFKLDKEGNIKLIRD